LAGGEVQLALQIDPPASGKGIEELPNGLQRLPQPPKPPEPEKRSENEGM